MCWQNADAPQLKVRIDSNRNNLNFQSNILRNFVTFPRANEICQHSLLLSSADSGVPMKVILSIFLTKLKSTFSPIIKEFSAAAACIWQRRRRRRYHRRKSIKAHFRFDCVESGRKWPRKKGWVCHHPAEENFLPTQRRNSIFSGTELANSGQVAHWAGYLRLGDHFFAVFEQFFTSFSRVISLFHTEHELFSTKAVDKL